MIEWFDDKMQHFLSLSKGKKIAAAAAFGFGCLFILMWMLASFKIAIVSVLVMGLILGMMGSLMYIIDESM